MPQDATALARAIRADRQTARGALSAAVARAEAQTDLGAVAHLAVEPAMMAAEAFDRLPAGADARRAPFAGVPVLVKDLGGPFRDMPVRAGSRGLPRAGNGADSQLAVRFRAAGLIPFGLTTTPEFGLSLASEPAIGPVCRNPLAPARSAGGSSGGAAAAVAAGIVAIAHATDAGGSIRVPAAACGLVGLKPGRGTIPGGPDYVNHLAGLASELAVCRSVRDCAAIFDAVSEKARAPVAQGALRIGVLLDTGPDAPTDPARAAGVESAARALEAMGHRLRPVRWDAIARPATASDRVFRTIVAANLAATVQDGIEPTDMEVLTQAILDEGRHLSATDLWRALQDALVVGRDLQAAFDGLDLLATPMLTTAPRPIGWLPTDHSDVAAHFAAMSAFAPLACLANVSGFPALTLPYGADVDGLPLPVQLIAPMGGEALLLAIAALLEAEGRWQQRFPVAGLAA